MTEIDHTVYEYGEEYFSVHGENLQDGMVFGVLPRSDRKGVYLHGFEPRCDETLDLRDWMGFEIEVSAAAYFDAELKVEFLNAFEQSSWSTAVAVEGLGGDYTLRAPLAQFSGAANTCSRWRFFKSLVLCCSPGVTFKSFRALRRVETLLYTPVMSLHAAAGSVVRYPITVINTGKSPRSIFLQQELYGYEAMETVIEPQCLTLMPGQSGLSEITVKVPQAVVPGGYEQQVISAVSNGSGEHAEKLTLSTGRSLPHPYIFGTDSDFTAVEEKIASTAWARELFEHYKKQVRELNVGDPDPACPFLYETHIAHIAYRAAVVWKLTGDCNAADKAIYLLRRVCDPEKGWLKTRRACSQELVHEGEFFKSIAMSYDLLYYHDEIKAGDRVNIEATLRGFMDLIDAELGRGHLSNWTLAELAGALFSAQVLQDRERMERFIFGTGGFTRHLAAGVADDGWWYEVSIGYNLLAAGLFTMMAKSCEIWGYELAHIKVPAIYREKISHAQSAQARDGLCSEVWGPHTRNYRNIEMQWDSIVSVADWRAVCFGLSDSCESKLTGFAKIDPRYDLAFTMFGKSSYANIVRRSLPLERDLIFGAAELPPSSEISGKSPSLYADNVGIAVLRSQKKGQQLREQISCTLKYGSHGGAHGHYDRLALNSLARYGRSMSNPENVWYSYHTLMYKFYVQNSIGHNMVTVDLKQQDPAEARRLLFYSGDHIQVCAAENITRWCDPPYGGWRIYGATHSFAEQCWLEGKYVPIPENPPEYTRRGNFTEPVLQRRAIVVTNDYVVVFDYVAGKEEHNYDLIYTIKGLRELTGYREIEKREKAEDNPLSCGQFITDCSLYEYTQSTRAAFSSLFDGKDEGGWLVPDRSDCNEPGVLNVDLHTLYPPAGQAVIGNLPANFTVHKQLEYAVIGDGKQLAAGHFGAWVLGRDDIALDITGMQEIVLRVKVTKVIEEKLFVAECMKTVFWGDPRIIDGKGNAIYLSSLKYETENIDAGNGPGIDYYGGPVSIQARSCPQALPSEPQDYSREACIRIKLAGLDARRFEACIGGDYPPGDESQLRKWHAVRVRGKSARFISILEPFEDSRRVASAEAQDENTVTVSLADGSVQVITISGFEDVQADIRVNFTGRQDGTATTETTVRNNG
jgi:hypothetical protein